MEFSKQEYWSGLPDSKESACNVRDLTFGDSKITADGDCSHEIKRYLLLGRKAMTKPRQYVKKQRHYFANTGPSSQSFDFPSSHVQMWELDCKKSWMPKYWCFWTVLLEKPLESPLNCKEINQSILKEINFEYSSEGLQHFGHLMWIAGSLEKTLMLGKIERKRRRGLQKMG